MIEYKSIGEACPEVLDIHEQYRENRYIWSLLRDFKKGEASVKRKNETYLPIPTGFILKSDIALAEVGNVSSFQSSFFDRKYNGMEQFNDDPNYHPNKPYSIYKHGAKVPSIVKHTVNGLMGLIIKKPMKFIDEESDIYSTTASKSEKEVNKDTPNDMSGEV